MNKTLNIIFIADCSGSMSGERIKAVNNAINSVANGIGKKTIQFIQIRPLVMGFCDNAFWIGNTDNWHNFHAEGATNLAAAYRLLDKKLYSISTDIPPILILLSDGEPNDAAWIPALKKLRQNPVFKSASKYCIAHNVTEDAKRVFAAFTKDKRRIINTYNPEALQKVIERVATISGENTASRNRHRNDYLTIKIIAKDISGIKGAKIYKYGRQNDNYQKNRKDNKRTA